MNKPNEKAKDIVLVNPPSTDEQEFGFLSAAGAHRPPLNLLNLAAMLLEHGYTVEIIDGPILGGGIDKIIELIKSFQPRFVGITAMTSFIHIAAEIAEKVHNALPETATIVGGVHVTTLPEETMERFRSFDYAILGEGDLTLVDLLETLDKEKDPADINGLAFRDKDGKITTTPRNKPIKDIDTLPMPAWHLLPNYVKTYEPTASRKTRLPSAYIVSSRGCPFKCTFCANVVHGSSYRAYSADYLMKIVNHMVKEYKVRDLTIYDENLVLNRKRVVDFCNQLIESNYDLTWSCDARADSIDEDIIDLMYRAGCRSIWFGMESGNAEILKLYKKGVSLEKLEYAARITSQKGIKACGSFIIGGPGETPETIKDTIRFAKRIAITHFVPFFYTPIPGAEAYENIKDYGTVDLDYRMATMTRPIFVPHGMTLEEVKKWYKRAFFSFYLRPKIIYNTFKELGPADFIRLSASSLTEVVKGAVQSLKK